MGRSTRLDSRVKCNTTPCLRSGRKCSSTRKVSPLSIPFHSILDDICLLCVEPREKAFLFCELHRVLRSALASVGVHQRAALFEIIGSSASPCLCGVCTESWRHVPPPALCGLPCGCILLAWVSWQQRLDRVCDNHADDNAHTSCSTHHLPAGRARVLEWPHLHRQRVSTLDLMAIMPFGMRSVAHLHSIGCHTQRANRSPHQALEGTSGKRPAV